MKLNPKRNFSLIVAVFIIVVLLLGIFIVGINKGKNNKEQTTKNTNTLKKENSKPEQKEIKNDVSLKKDVPMKNNDKGIPVLMYHSIGFEKGNEIRIPKEKFEEQMKFLKDNDFQTLTLDEAYEFFINNKPVPEKSVVLTFDDGYEDNFQDMYPILKKYGFKATIFIVTNWVGTNSAYMTLDQLKELDKNGIDIQSHTANHEHLSQLTYEKQLKTLKESKEFLEKNLDKKISYIAYPFGDNNKQTVKATKDAGYTMAFTTAGRWSDKTDGIFTLDRVYIAASADIKEFKERITNPNYKTK